MKRRRYLIDGSIYPIFITTPIVYWIPVFSEKPIAIKALEAFENLRAQMQGDKIQNNDGILSLNFVKDDDFWRFDSADKNLVELLENLDDSISPSGRGS